MLIEAPNPAQVVLQAVFNATVGIVSATVKVYNIVSGSENDVLSTTSLTQVGTTNVWRYVWTPTSLPAGQYTISGVATDASGATHTWVEDLNILTFSTVVSGAPSVTGITPAVGTQLSANQSVSFTVTDTAGLSFQSLIVVFSFPNGAQEVAFNGTSVAGFYAGSVATQLSSSSWSFSFARTGGWLGAPSLNVYAVDTVGQENPQTQYSWPLAAPSGGGTVVPPAQGNNPTLALSTAQLLSQMQSLFPLSWVIPEVTGQQSTLKTTILQAAAATLGEVGDSLLIPTRAPNGVYEPLVKQQLRIKSASGSVLDQIALDFFGTSLARLAGESDASLLNRIELNLFVIRGTRAAIVNLLTGLTGVAPRITEPWRPNEHGAWSKTSGAPALSGGLYYYALAAGSPGNYWGVDTSYSSSSYSALPAGPPYAPPAFRYANPGRSPGPQTAASTGAAFQGFIDTTYPLGAGAQGNIQKGFSSAVPVLYPPSQSAVGAISHISGDYYYGSSLSPAAPTLIGGGYVSASSLTVVNGKSYYTTTTGDPTSAFWNNAGLTTKGYEAAGLQILSAVDSFRPYGVGAWVRVVPIPLLVSMTSAATGASTNGPWPP